MAKGNSHLIQFATSHSHSASCTKCVFNFNAFSLSPQHWNLPSRIIDSFNEAIFNNRRNSHIIHHSSVCIELMLTINVGWKCISFVVRVNILRFHLHWFRASYHAMRNESRSSEWTRNIQIQSSSTPYVLPSHIISKQWYEATQIRSMCLPIFQIP